MTSARFTDRARSSRSASPDKVSQKEGYLILLASGLTFLFVSIRLVAPLSPSTWLAATYTLSPFVFLISILCIAVMVGKARKVQPYGWKRAYAVATLLAIATVVIGEYLWTRSGGNTDLPAVAFLIGALAATPFAALGTWKVAVGS